MEATELARWTRFAAKGGIGKCTAAQDWVAEHAEDLMFLKDDEIIVLMQLPEIDVYLGYCEGVVGRFHGRHVQFHTRLKIPVMSKRPSVTSKSPSSKDSSAVPLASSFDSDHIPRLADAPSPSITKLDTFAAQLHSSHPSITSDTLLSSLADHPSDTARLLSSSLRSDLTFSSNASKDTTSIITPQSPSSDSPSSSRQGTSDLESTSPPPMSHSSSSSLTESFPVTPLSPLPIAVHDITSPSTKDSVGQPYHEGGFTNVRPLNIRRKGGDVIDPPPSAPATSSVYCISPDEEPLGHRASSATSDGEVGIGLSLLQDLANGSDMDDGSSAGCSSSGHETVTLSSKTPHRMFGDLPAAFPNDTSIVQTSGSQTEDLRTNPLHSFALNQPAQSPAADDWEGAFDIYDDYRYSRMSHISKRSKRSQSSESEPAATTLESLPPMPSNAGPNILFSRPESPLHSPAGVDTPTIGGAGYAVATSQELATSDLRPKERPIPLNVENTPLLHTSFGSPEPSPKSLTTFRAEPDLPSAPVDLPRRRSWNLSLNSPSKSAFDANIHPASPRSPSSFSKHPWKALNVDNFSSSLSAFPSPPGVTSMTHAVFPQPPSPRASPVTSPSSSAPRPSLAFNRRSLFLPHPNAPKAPTSSTGPLYGRNLANQSPQDPAMLHSRSAIYALRQAAAAHYGANHSSRLRTIYGQCELDLCQSSGPIPIAFSLEPPSSGSNNSTDRKPMLLSSSPRASDVPPAASSPSQRSASPVVPAPQRHALPRASFFPKVQTLRPRSRSFSAFDSHMPDVPLFDNRRREEGSEILPLQRRLSQRTYSDDAFLLRSFLDRPTPFRTGSQDSRMTPAPSPLGHSSIPMTPNKLCKVSMIHGQKPEFLHSHIPSAGRKISSRGHQSDGDGSGTILKESSYLPQAMTEDRKSIDDRSEASLPLARNRSLRKKMSLPSLRSRNASGSGRHQESPHHSQEHGAQPSGDRETVQVKDMDFELVKPIAPPYGSSRTSVDSSTRDDSPHPTYGLLRVDSPSLSVSSGAQSDQRSPSSIMEFPFSVVRDAKPSDPDHNMEAHRQRELKWMSLMSAVPPAQARKNRKVKKLLFEGVPSSVRYLVWAHLTESKAKAEHVQGLYQQLGNRGRISASDEVEADAALCFQDHAQLHGAQGPVVSLLQAYLAMVPDIRYSTGLTQVAGHLLLLSPEEDAFWIFVSLMDTHLRGYFSHNAIQLDIDALLFRKALEANDSPVAKKLFLEMGMSPVSVCQPWFTSLFAEALPVEYLHRVWDIFLYEGVIFLFRVGLALFVCNRRQLLESGQDEAVYRCLRRPSPFSLPPTTDAFISLVFSMKLRDDEVRKQRVKMESTMKRQTQSRLIPSGDTRAMASISSPRI